MPSVTQARADEPYATAPSNERNRRSALHLIHQLTQLKDVTDKHRKEQLKIGLWKWTEAEGIGPYAKFNTRYFSEGVMEQRLGDMINHEHVWTLKSHVQTLVQGEWTIEQLEEHLIDKGAVYIVTVDEHARLNRATTEGWGRYVEAGIRVFDRLVRDWKDLSEDTGVSGPSVEIAGPGREVPDVSRMVDEHARNPEVRKCLHQLLRMARFASAAPAPSWKRSGSVSPYFRLYDGIIEEPTRAVAYVHWTGKTDFALQIDDLPGPLATDPLVRQLQDPVFGISVSIKDERSLAVAEELLFLALQKLRAA